MSNSTDNLVAAYRQDLNYWLERKTEYQSALNVLASKGGNNESAWKLKGKLEAVDEMITHLQRKSGI
ncbi:MULTISPECIES: hypothetical protein [unclassified Coleofasciculus]|uniref:hypothetical protein n=1 Tax=unclassified Coleofasciculus TaxID=2692782 RepID=UPI00187E2B21|nr:MULTISPECIES: hypothetical protein [unclassified Coleofasciculus]MBE9129747.1 hypothetical protein [Coleofasciculus sp. LEGE 07081]MBE9152234.1 hypothetical protein [Coleofasciculus sp. LEGE 07092]